MKRGVQILVLFLLLSVTFVAVRQASGQNAPAARCQIAVPSNWGEFVGASSYGLTFRDDQGTLRFITQLPCGLAGTPNVALEIRRQ